MKPTNVSLEIATNVITAGSRIRFTKSGVSISLPWDSGVALLPGRDYPNSYAELRAWFNEDWKWLNYLDWLRWPVGYVFPWCAPRRSAGASDGRWRCASCDRRQLPQGRSSTAPGRH